MSSSVRPSVCNVEVSWSHKMEYFENNFATEQRRVLDLCRPQHHRSTPKKHPQILAGIEVEYWKSGCRRTKSPISLKWLKIERSHYKAVHKLSIAAKMCDLSERKWMNGFFAYIRTRKSFTPCLKTVQNYCGQNFVKFPPTMKNGKQGNIMLKQLLIAYSA